MRRILSREEEANIPPNLKFCLKCKQIKDRDDCFNSDSSRKDGKEPYCKNCGKERRKTYYKNNQTVLKERNLEYNRRPDVKKRKQEYEKLPKVRERRRQQDRQPARRRRDWELDQRPEAKQKQKEYDRKRNQLPEKKEAHRQQVTKYALEHPEWKLVQNAKQRARKKGVPFSIEPKDIVIPDCCPILGILIKIGAGMNQINHAASIDEIKPGVGYVVGNVAVISKLANTIKNDGTAEEHRKIAEWMENRTQPDIIRPASTKKEKRVVTSAKQRAKGKGFDFDIRLEDIHFPERCPVLDVLLESGTRHSHENAPSLDRVDSSKGYTFDNVAIISHRANFVKSNGTAQQHRAIADWIIQSTAA